MQQQPSVAYPGFEKLASLLSYRSLMYVSIFFSGCIALTFQIVWQKYLSFLVGSEARSISLVIAVFLLGLAAGYRFWGNLTERKLSRQTILKIVGYIELGIAGYAILFAQLFAVVREISYAAPDWLVVDLAITLVLLFVPTFLMGASIPLLTAAIPEHVDEVNHCHSRVYGINTLGAFLGAFIGGFYLLPNFGLPISLLIGAAVNIAVAVVFILNRVDGPMHKAQEMPSIPNSFGVAGIYLFVFVTGAVSIAYEVLFIRILGLTIGSGHYVFPIVVGIVILGLAIGSLTIRRGSITANRVFAQLIALSALLVVLYFTVPLWPLWLSHVRISLTSIPSNYGVFLLITILFVAAMLLPVIIPMGRLLPIGYSLADKTSSDYGKICGRIYFVNTFGTVLGAVGIGYVLFLFFELDTIFKINLMLILLLTAFLYMRHASPRASVACLALAGGVLLLPGWDRQLHRAGLFRFVEPQAYHSDSLLRVPTILEKERQLFLRDDPSMTVAVNTIPIRDDSIGEIVDSRSIIVNGKSDGNTIADYSNMVLTGVIPYLYAPRAADLNTVVVGLGTGITSGALARAGDVASVTTLEISPAVIEAAQYFEADNFGLLNNPKTNIVQTDAFRFFSRARNQYDIIVSEPSNPWVVGVENLFTPEYYHLVNQVLADDGVFFQWVQIYEMNDAIFAAIVENVINAFPHVRMFVIGSNDVGILASRQPLSQENMARRRAEAAIDYALRPMALDGESPLALLTLFDTQQLRMIALNNTLGIHRLDYPWLGHVAGRSRFLGESVTIGSLLQPDVARHLDPGSDRNQVMSWLDEGFPNWQHRCRPLDGHSAGFVCEMVETFINYSRIVREPPSPGRVLHQLEAYNGLRVRGLIDADPAFFRNIEQLLLQTPSQFPPGQAKDIGGMLVREMAFEWRWQHAAELAARLRDAGVISPTDFDQALRRVQEMRSNVERLMTLWEAQYGAPGQAGG